MGVTACVCVRVCWGDECQGEWEWCGEDEGV